MHVLSRVICCKQALLVAASARTLAAKVLIFAATTPCSWLNRALVVVVELSLRCWPSVYGDRRTTGCQMRQALTWGCST